MEPQTQFKYLFEAELQDGSVFVQNAEDSSEVEPETRTAFFDLLHHSKDNPVKRFTIKNEKESLTVDLTTGNFEHNGVPILIPVEQIPTANPKFKLIYHRAVQRHFNVQAEQKSMEIVGFFIGWEVTVKKIVNGKEVLQSYKQILGLN